MNLTEAEELELLELEEEEARANAAPQEIAPAAAKPAEPSQARAGIIGGTQGLTFGFGDEIGAGIGQFFVPKSDVKPGAAAQPSPDDTPEVAAAKAQLNAERPSSYDLIRDGMRDEAAAAEKAHPKTYNAAELGGAVATSFVPVGAIAKGVGVGAKGIQAVSKAPTALKAAGLGALNAFGHAEGSAGEQALETAGGAATGAILDKGLRFVGGKLKNGKLAEWFRSKATDAGDEAIRIAEAAKGKAVKSASGGMGSEAADIIRARAVAEKTAEKLASVNPELAAKLRAAADSPEALARLQAAAENYLPRLTEGLEGFAQKEGELLAAKARDPVAEAAEKLAHPVKEFFDPRMKKHLMNLAGRPALMGAGLMMGDAIDGEDGGMLGKTLGTGAGFGLSLALGGGRAGDVIMNRLNSPATRKFAADVGEKALGGLGSFAEGLARPAVLEATDDPEKFKALADWLRSRDGQ